MNRDEQRLEQQVMKRINAFDDLIEGRMKMYDTMYANFLKQFEELEEKLVVTNLRIQKQMDEYFTQLDKKTKQAQKSAQMLKKIMERVGVHSLEKIEKICEILCNEY